MRRTRRNRLIQLSVFILLYSIIAVYSEKDEEPPETIKEIKLTTTSTPNVIKATSKTEKEPTSTAKSKIENENLSTEKPEEKNKHKNITTTTEAPENLNVTENSTLTNVTAVKNDDPFQGNCTPPAIQQFPKPLIGPYGRKHGAIIIHILVAIYTFFGLAIVCDEYFVASLDRICEELKMAPDVAGATFMAAGSSAPELATVVIGVFFAKDDIGISGVIGSAVFNIMFVISICALCSGTVAYLNWWPMVRDCFFYAVSILVLLITIYDKTITWGESLFMLLMYVVYCIALHFNTFLEKWAQSLPVPCKKRPQPPTEQSGLVTYKNIPEPALHQIENEPKQPQNYGGTDPEEYDFNKSWEDPNEQWGSEPKKQPETQNWDDPNGSYAYDNQVMRGAELNQSSDVVAPPQANVPPLQLEPPFKQDYYRPKEFDPSKVIDPLIKPEGGGPFVLCKWYLIFPIHYMCKKTMPDCRTDKYKNWYPFTFFISMIWISFYSYFMVWMITIIGSTLNIPDTVMGLTFVAAGVSVPDALSSIAVLKEGYGDMAVSNAVGSNVFDILICLGLPWFLKTAVFKPGSTVKVISKGLTYSTISLFTTIVFLITVTHLNGWKMDKRLGVMLMAWYLVFLAVASMYELNVFGPMNPPECASDY